MNPFNLKVHQEIKFRYKGQLIDDGLFIKVENTPEECASIRRHGDPEPDVPYPRLRVMFSGSTFGRFAIADITELEVK